MQGTIIVIEGSDGSGKQTQTKLLADRLEGEGYQVLSFSFPRYDEQSSYFVRQYLEGGYGSAEAVGPYKASLFYAMDRFAAAADIQHAVDQGKVVILDRYVGSNMAHQGTKFQHAEERRGFFIWLDNLEFELLGIPRPSKSFVLRVPFETSLMLLEARRKSDGSTQDIHEADLAHLERSVAVYNDICQLFPKDFTPIDCTYRGSLLPIETVHELLWRHVAPYLPPKTGQQRADTQAAAAPARDSIEAESTPAVTPPRDTNTAADEQPAPATQTQPAESPVVYVVPEALPDAIHRQYEARIDHILMLQREIQDVLTEHLRATRTTGEAADAASTAEAIAGAVLPVGVLVARHPVLRSLILSSSGAANRHISALLPAEHAAQTGSGVRLVGRTPRNEFDALPDILYPYSSLTLRELQSDISGWSYEQKAAALETAITASPESMRHFLYTWDILSSITGFANIASRFPDAVSHQACSPRYGYQVPEVLEEAGLSDAFETCFDTSLELYSILQAAGKDAEAQYAVLSGHMVRWKLTLTGESLGKLSLALPTSSLVRQLLQTVSEVHPLITESLPE